VEFFSVAVAGASDFSPCVPATRDLKGILLEFHYRWMAELFDLAFDSLL
jgi:hypothetical protein